jgi:hypothetical protein
MKGFKGFSLMLLCLLFAGAMLAVNANFSKEESSSQICKYKVSETPNLAISLETAKLAVIMINQQKLVTEVRIITKPQLKKATSESTFSKATIITSGHRLPPAWTNSHYSSII